MARVERLPAVYPIEESTIQAPTATGPGRLIPPAQRHGAAGQDDRPRTDPALLGEGLCPGAVETHHFGYKVLHVTECRSGGVPRAIASYARNTPEFEHHFLGPVDALNDTGDVFDAVIPLPSTHISRVKALDHATRQTQYDVIHAHSSWAGVYSRIWQYRVPVVYQPHGFAFEYASGPFKHLYFYAEKLLAKRARLLVAVSDHEACVARDIGKIPVLVIPNVSSIAPGRRPTTSLGTPRRVGMIGRMEPPKDPSFFAETCRLYSNAVAPEAEFVWIGDGDPQAQKLLTDAGVRVTGWLREDELVAQIRSLDAYVHASTSEAFPLSVLDAAASGTPIMVRDIPAFEGTNLVAVESAAQASAALQQLFGDPDVAVDLRRRSQQLSQRWSPHAQRVSLLQAYALAVRQPALIPSSPE